MSAYVYLEDGTRLDGDLCGDTGPGPLSHPLGEVVFNTSMSGYQESVTDPSYRGQIIVFTYPLVGNYGVSAEAMESDRVHSRAVIMREAIDREDAPGAEGGWLTWLADCGVPGLTGLDTRALVRHIRDAGQRVVEQPVVLPQRAQPCPGQDQLVGQLHVRPRGDPAPTSRASRAPTRRRTGGRSPPARRGTTDPARCR